MKKEVAEKVIKFLERVPAIKKPITFGGDEEFWWFKFQFDLKHNLSWNVIQELGHLLNYIATEARLPTAFYPVSPPPYMNGGPEYFLSWVIENTAADFTPESLLEWLEGRLPSPVENAAEWTTS